MNAKKPLINKAAREFFKKCGRQGGLLGGNARAAALSAEDRSAIARKAARARWDRRAADLAQDDTL